MTLANPIAVVLNTVSKDLPKINLDNYGSEYLYQTTTYELRLKIRHSKETPKAGQKAFDRHNVELTQTVYATSTVPVITRQAYLVIRNTYDDDKTAVSYLAQALIDLITDAHIDDVLAWQS